MIKTWNRLSEEGKMLWSKREVKQDKGKAKESKGNNKGE